MSDEYYDVPITFKAVISISAKDRREAEEQLYSMDDEELLCLLSEQVHFIGMDEDTQVQ
tara:strand:- start:196 stop:372 length:177 start_codon:yes stop_codon:yes gene_type:complete